LADGLLGQIGNNLLKISNPTRVKRINVRKFFDTGKAEEIFVKFWVKLGLRVKSSWVRPILGVRVRVRVRL
jgi:hypothetical protein